MARVMAYVAATMLAVLLFPPGIDQQVLPDAPPLPPPNPYDSLRTDLSDYIWPTDASHVITSAFGEFRQSHFHGGIDISTQDRTGFRVFASRDGYIARIRISPVGYGKMLYVRHPDGYTTTYAHLQRFAPAIDQRAASEQRALECFPVDFTCPPGEFPVRKGDLIAYTGDTGIGSAHLHFEIRDEHMNPMNPLLCPGLVTPDNIPPTLRKLSVTPIGGESLVNGAFHTQIYHVRPLSRTRFHVREAIRITGTAGLAVDARDLSNGTYYKHGVYSHKLYVDDSLLYAITMDRVPGGDSYQIKLDYEWELIDQRRGRFEKLFTNTPNELPFYTPRTDRAGQISAAAIGEGEHAFRIVTADLNGNASELTGSLVLTRPFTLDVTRRGPDLVARASGGTAVRRFLIGTSNDDGARWKTEIIGRGRGELSDSAIIPIPSDRAGIVRIAAEDAWGATSPPHYVFLRPLSGPALPVAVEHDVEDDFVRVSATTKGVFTSTPSIAVEEGSFRRVLDVHPLSLNRCTATFAPLESFQGARRIAVAAEVNGHPVNGVEEFEVYPLVPGTPGTLSLDKGNLLLAYDSLSVYKTMYLTVEKDAGPEDVLYALEPERGVLHTGITVTLRVNPARKSQGVFFLTPGGRTFAAAAAPGADAVTTHLGETLGGLLLMTDNTAPTISRLVIAPRGSRRPTISFRVGDDLSGVEYNDLKMYIDGVVAIPEIDGEHHRAVLRVGDPLVRGSHQLTIRLKDRMGNARDVQREFPVR